MRQVSSVIFVLCLAAATSARAQEEIITDVQVKNAIRTSEQTVRSIAGIEIGEPLRSDTLDIARERLHTSGLFSDVNVYWEPHGVGVRVVIVIGEKFPWAPLPTFSYAPGDVSGGLLIAHGNLFGLGKRGLIGGRVSTVNSGAIVAYEDPSVFGSWAFFTIKAKYQSQTIPEYANVDILGMPLAPVRDTNLRTYGYELSAGVAWFRRVRTAVGWNLDRNDVRSSQPDQGNPVAMAYLPTLPPATKSARRGAGTATLTFDFRARERSLMYGNALGFGVEWAAPRWGSQSNLWYWKASASYEHGIRFFRWHNLIVRAGGITGENLPLWSENSAGGTNLRGYLYHQFQGDTHLYSQIEYHFPLFSLGALDVRGLLFNDNAAIWWRTLPQPIVSDGGSLAYAPREDGRQFLPPYFLEPGFKANRDIHSSAGAGLRFYLRTVAVPLVGVDVGNGLGTKDVRVILVLGV